MSTDKVEGGILKQFLAYNEEWAQRPDVAEVIALTAKAQSPKVLWFGCADSRVPEAAICGTKPGEIFVHRNIANCVHPGETSAQAVLSFAVENLGIENIVVVGHYACGGVNAALRMAKDRLSLKYSVAEREGSYIKSFGNDDEGPAIISKWLAPLKAQAIAQLREHPDLPQEEASRMLVRAHTIAQVNNIENSPVIQNAIRNGRNITVDGWVYDVATGKLEDLIV